MRRKKQMREAVEKLGARLARARKDVGLTQADLARRLQCSRVTVARIETGLKRPSLETFVAICQELGANPGEVLEMQARPPLSPNLRPLFEKVAALSQEDVARVADYISLIEKAR